MKSRTWIILVILLACLSMPALAGDVETEGPPPEEPTEWESPDCNRVTGQATVTFTDDKGVTMADMPARHGTFYTYGLTTLDLGNTLLTSNMSSDGTDILRSDDAGCNWHKVETLPVSELLLLTSAPEGVAYGWSRSRTTFYRIDGDEVVTYTAPGSVYGLAVDPEDNNHIRIGGRDCQIYESFDGGARFSMLGNPANSGNTIFYTVEFDPVDWDNALCGGIGAWRTDDAGQTWSGIEPFDYEDRDIVYLFVYSKDDPSRVWARASLETMSAYTRQIMVSHDGGATFGPAISQGDEALDQNGITRQVILIKQPAIAAHPRDDVLYFAWGMYFQDYGTDLFRYDISEDELTVVHIAGLDGIDAIAFNPVNTDVMYLGLESENISLAKAAAELNEVGKASKFTISPNPFNPTTTFRFSLETAAKVKIDVYNIAGRKISTVVDAYLSAGDHGYEWNGSNAPSGVYLVRRQVGETTESHKMVLLK